MKINLSYKKWGFLATTDYALKALKYGTLPQWKPNLKHFFLQY